MPALVNARARFGLSEGSCGVRRRPECSPVTSSPLTMVRPRCVREQLVVADLVVDVVVARPQDVAACVACAHCPGHDREVLDAAEVHVVVRVVDPAELRAVLDQLGAEREGARSAAIAPS